ncbi:TetR/AcrR family transcriptional regulator [Paracoccus ravus]|uniref:TetR/AcrR family transcriptional regulator n=1 Tax=Paracoccus ravus TaxID=2447760 RepID=UPI00106EEC52|nr:TetR/AcrR family transcriptional regulator [Paracoccus ravus]
MYQQLIIAAQNLLVSQGRMPGSLAELAHLAEVSEEDVLQNFDSLAALREGLIYQGVALLNDRLKRGVLDADSTNPDVQLRALARSYAEWADENPALFQLLAQGLNMPLVPGSTLFRFTISMRDLFERKLKEMLGDGLLRPETDIAAIMLLLHCLVRGANDVITLRPHDPWLQGDPRPSPAIAGELFDYFLDSMLAANAPIAEAM